MEQINANLQALSLDNASLQEQMILRDRRLITEQDIDIASLKGLLTAMSEVRECINGVCSLGAWRPSR